MFADTEVNDIKKDGNMVIPSRHIRSPLFSVSQFLII